ncbi:MAG TPA: hypothetical protein VHS09_11600 [Polyangiaceae bacterium]|jgi:hypothetical protein|nr:hypothetical protein [Polyangiaceae bacterium]
MRAFLPAFLVGLLGVAACAASAPPPPVATASPGAACGETEQQAVRRIGAVIAAHETCATDADCERVSQGGSCFDHCTIAMAREGEPALQAVAADVAAHECRDFAAQGCHAVSPPCMPLPAPVCREGKCQ